jgi:PIN domain nuclease of toxin-antitoxin system
LRALLDTSVFLWADLEQQRLSRSAREFITDGANGLVLSAATAWEIAIKHAKGQLKLPADPDAYMALRISLDALDPLAIEISHAVRAGTLPPIHHDPFDRLLVAQSQLEGIPILTSDPNIARYGVRIVW